MRFGLILIHHINISNFAASKNVTSKQQVFLVCHGLDTIANVSMNGILVGKSSNMFSRYIYDIKEALKVSDLMEILKGIPILTLGPLQGVP